ncbi:hypothetical protein GDO78_021124 [Eleutherodactylus coqui]|uniref:Uncharacterized protein n=1 Tax=Eleutherodactylus coqui TaxID=57060 RepID=A0A8J6B004_ELECQ|nr:hypothetical protein GDO78_021124 [Eleutherodactylus coqui]
MDLSLHLEGGTPDTSAIFAYTMEDADRVLSGTKTDCSFLNSPNIKLLQRNCESTKKRLISLKLRAIILREYYTAKRIPRGLRPHVQPTLMMHDVECCTEFINITNK